MITDNFFKLVIDSVAMINVYLKAESTIGRPKTIALGVSPSDDCTVFSSRKTGDIRLKSLGTNSVSADTGTVSLIHLVVMYPKSYSLLVRFANHHVRIDSATIRERTNPRGFNLTDARVTGYKADGVAGIPADAQLIVALSVGSWTAIANARHEPASCP